MNTQLSVGWLDSTGLWLVFGYRAGDLPRGAAVIPHARLGGPPLATWADGAYLHLRPGWISMLGRCDDLSSYLVYRVLWPAPFQHCSVMPREEIGEAGG